MNPAAIALVAIGVLVGMAIENVRPQKIKGFQLFGLPTKSEVNPAETDKYREEAGVKIQTLGLYRSIFTSLLTDITQFQVWKPKINALQEYLTVSGIEEEINPALTTRLMDNIKILGRIQEDDLQGKDRRDAFLSKKVTWKDLPPMEEAKLYAKYAISCYGDKVMQGAEMDVDGTIDLRLDVSTKSRVAEHVGVDEADIVEFNLAFAGKADELRHYLAVNHERKAIVLAIRGTFTFSEVVTDITGFTEPFCGGQAHADIAKMSVKLWDRIGAKVVEALVLNPNYELIVTGHSLGGGAANLLNILLHENKNSRIGGRKVRCFSYASPPVFSPLELIPQAVQDGVNYSHEMDDVPFLCGYSVRHLFNSLAVLENATHAMSSSERRAIANGEEKPPQEVVDKVLAIKADDFDAVPGVEEEFLPVKASVWIRRTNDGTYDAKICDPKLLSKSPIYVDPRRSLDHFPARYERCFKDW